MSTPFYRLIPGSFLIIGKAPDGDSVRFKPNHPQHFEKLFRAYLIKPSKTDGSVQLRLDGIDAPELHYGSAAQPLGVESRDHLLRAMGWTSVSVKAHSSSVIASAPAEISGAILSKAAEVNGRPIAFVLVGDDAKVSAAQTHVGWVHLDDALLKKTMNHQMLSTGMAYPTFYSSLSPQIQTPLREIALAARNRRDGVWSVDSTSLFKLESQADIDPQSGNLILPKLFRRATDYLKDVAKGYRKNLRDWIEDHQSGSRSENDRVYVAHINGELPLSMLLEQRNDKIAFLPDILDVVFVDK